MMVVGGKKVDMLLLFEGVEQILSGRGCNMSTQVLSHGFGIRGYRHVRMETHQGQLTFTVDRPREKIRCPACGADHVHTRGGKTRVWKCLPIGSRPVSVAMHVPSLECQACSARRQVAVTFADPKRSYTKNFECYVLDLSHSMTIEDIARHLGVGWDLVKAIIKHHLHHKYRQPKLRHLRHIAIDEISNAKGHKYLTVVLDLDTGRVVYVGKGKKESSLEPFWKRLKASRAKIAAVAIDLSAAYQLAVKKHLPEAHVVFDRFHIIKLYNEKLTGLRRALYREATDLRQKKVLKGTRWLLLKRPENLDESRDEHTRLREALELNESLALAYYMKDDLNEVWEQDTQKEAESHLMDWILRAEASGIAMLIKFAQTLRRHALGILAWYDFEISTGPLEGVNNKIKTLKRQAYGYRDLEFFKLKIYALHESNYKLIG